MELADLVVVTKSDGDLKQAAARTAADYAHALHLMRPKYPGLSSEMRQVSALEGRGIAEVWTAVRAFHDRLSASGRLARLRERQLRRWFWNEVQAILEEEISGDSEVAKEAQAVEAEVAAGNALPEGAARRLIERFRGS
jgi:LAO/AO transport system kinase